MLKVEIQVHKDELNNYEKCDLWKIASSEYLCKEARLSKPGLISLQEYSVRLGDKHSGLLRLSQAMPLRAPRITFNLENY